MISLCAADQTLKAKMPATLRQRKRQAFRGECQRREGSTPDELSGLRAACERAWVLNASGAAMEGRQDEILTMGA